MRQRSPDDEILKDEYYRDNRGEIDRRSQQSIQKFTEISAAVDRDHVVNPRYRPGARQSPELNPVENVWQFMRDNWLSNRIFKSYEDIVALCCQAWNNLIDQPWKIMSLGMRKWAHGF